MPENYKPTLKRLQNLEHEFETIAEQVRALGNIILHQDGDEEISRSRCQWALRWLLKKFSGALPLASNIRALPSAWEILSRSIEKTSTPALAQILSQYPLFHCVILTLQENYGESPNSRAEDHYPKTSVGAEKRSPSPRTGKRKFQEYEPSLKRRRVSVDSESTIDNHDQRRTTLFQNLMNVLKHLLKRLDSSSYHFDSSSALSLECVLRLDHTEVAQVLGAGFDAINYMLTTSQNANSMVDSGAASDLEVFVQLWERQKPRPQSNTLLNSDVHDGKALISALQSLVQAQKQSKQQDLLSSHLESGFVYDVERFLAKYHFSPLKVVFQATYRDEQRTDQSSSSAETDLDMCPCGAFMQVLEPKNHWADVGSIIYELSLKCIDLHQPRQREKDILWLNHVFQCVMGLYEKFRPLTDFDFSRQNAIKSMLCSMKAKKLQLNDPRLVITLLHHSGVPQQDDVGISGESAISWDLVALILSLAPGIFVAGLRKGVLRKGDSDPLDLLVECISTRVKRSYSPDSEQYSTMRDKADYDTVKSKIFGEICRGFVTARAQMEFLSVWHEQLEVVIASRGLRESDKTAHFSVWEDPVVLSTISASLIPTMLTSRKVEAITSLIDVEPPGPAFIVLHSLIQGLASDEITIEVLKIIDHVRTRCISILQQSNEHGNSRLNIIAWRLLTSSCLVWIIESPAPVLQFKGHVNNADSNKSNNLSQILGLVEQCWKRIDGNGESSQLHSDSCFQEAIHGLSCVLKIIHQMSQRHIQPLEDLAKTLPLPAICEKVVRVLSELPVCKALSQITTLLSEYSWVILSLEAPESLYPLFEKHVTMENDHRQRMPPGNMVKTLLELVTTKAPKLRGTSRGERFRKSKQTSRGVIEPLIKAYRSDECTPELADILSSGSLMVWEEQQIQAKILQDILSRPLQTDFEKSLSLLSACQHDTGGSNVESCLGLAQLLDQHEFTNTMAGHEYDELHTMFESFVETRLYRQKARNEDIGKKAKSSIDSSFSLLKKPLTMTFLYSLIQFYLNHEPAQKTSERNAINELCITIVHHLPQEIFNLWHDPNTTTLKRRTTTALNLLGLLEMRVLRENSTAIQNIVNQVEKSAIDHVPLSISVLHLKWKLQMINSKAPLFTLAERIIETSLTHRNYHQLQEVVGRAVVALPTSQRDDVLSAFINSPQDSALSPTALRLLNLTLTSGTDWSSEVTLPIFSRLTTTLMMTSVYSSFLFATSAIQHILILKSTRLSQSALESLLAALGRLTSSSAPGFDGRRPRKIFGILCRFIHTTLARNVFRKRLRGRAHLLVPILQGLMRSFFTPMGRTNKDRLRQVPWLGIENTKELMAGSQHRLLPRHGHLFGRVLTLLCDPPLSAVSSASASRNKPSMSSNEPQGLLTDPLIQARVSAAQSAPLLLGELVNCTLRARYCSEGVREALLPGIWALVNVVSSSGIGIEKLGGVCGNEGQREILRELVGEWRRFGGGRQ